MTLKLSPLPPFSETCQPNDSDSQPEPDTSATSLGILRTSGECRAIHATELAKRSPARTKRDVTSGLWRAQTGRRSAEWSTELGARRRLLFDRQRHEPAPQRERAVRAETPLRRSFPWWLLVIAGLAVALVYVHERARPRSPGAPQSASRPLE